VATGSLDLILAVSFIWLGFCTIGYYIAPRKDWVTQKIKSPLAIGGLALLVALLVRLIPAALLPRGAEYDIDSFRRVAETLLQGGTVYDSPLVAGRHPYLPFQLYLIWGAGYVSSVSKLPFVFLIKLVPILADAVLTVLIFKIALNSGQTLASAFSWSLLYALNPVSILVSAYHGQFDAETVLLLVLAWYFWRFGKQDALRLGCSALILGLAILNKSWAAMFLPIVFFRLKSTKQRFLYALIALATPVVFTVLYIVAFHDAPYPLLHRALTHAGVPGWWGASAVASLTWHLTGIGQGVVSWLAQYGRWPILVGAGCVYWVTRRQLAMDAWVTLLVVIYVLTSGFGLQWTLWVVPFAILAGDLWRLDRYTLAALLYMLPAYYGYHLEPLLLRWLSSEQMNVVLIACAIPVWLVCVWWALSRMRDASRDQTTVRLKRAHADVSRNWR
jgi:Gpi18-like mannosyltransferase